MNDLRNGIWATDNALEIAPRVDTVVFDVDGVLVDVSQSFRVCICRAVQHFLSVLLEWPGEEAYLRPEDTEPFKRAGGFNSDWGLTDAAALLFLVKGVDTCDRRAATLRAAPPTVEEYTAEIARRGGGLDNAVAALRDVAAPDTMARALDLWDRPLLRQLFCEYYAGRARCRDVYGFDAQHVTEDDGELVRERVLLDPALLPPTWRYGVVTGRDRGEWNAARPMLGVDHRIPANRTLTADDGMHKPDPAGLLQLADLLRPAAAVYVGDTLDDLRTVLNYRQRRAEPPFLACQVLSGPAGERNRQFFAEAGADVIAPDVNALLRWLAAQGGAA